MQERGPERGGAREWIRVIVRARERERVRVSVGVTLSRLSQERRLVGEIRCPWY